MRIGPALPEVTRLFGMRTMKGNDAVPFCAGIPSAPKLREAGMLAVVR